MSDNLRVQYDRPETVYEMCDSLVDIDPIELRDLAQNLLADVETLKARVAELEAYPAMSIDPGAEQRGYDKARTDAAAMIRSQAADIVRRALADAGVSISVAEEHPFVAAMELAARIVEATKETPDHA